MKQYATAYVVVLHLALVAVLAKPYAIANKIAGDEPLRESAVQAVRAAHLSGDSLVPAGSVVFLGDSITMGMPVSAVSPRAVNYGIGWQRSDQLLDAVGSYRSLAPAGAVVVLIGTNDVLQGKADGIEGRYRALAAAIPAPLVMVSPPPIEGHEEAVQQVRAAVRKVCGERPRCTFVDAYSALSIPGALQKDHIHPTEQGYGVLVPLLRQALVANVTPTAARSF